MLYGYTIHDFLYIYICFSPSQSLTQQVCIHTIFVRVFTYFFRVSIMHHLRNGNQFKIQCLFVQTSTKIGLAQNHLAIDLNLNDNGAKIRHRNEFFSFIVFCYCHFFEHHAKSMVLKKTSKMTWNEKKTHFCGIFGCACECECVWAFAVQTRVHIELKG